jgi:hypothetical protein
LICLRDSPGAGSSALPSRWALTSYVTCVTNALVVAQLGLRRMSERTPRRVGGAQHRGHELEADLVEQPGEELARHVCAAGDEDVLGARCIPCALQSVLDPVGDEDVRRDALLADRLGRTMVDDEAGAWNHAQVSHAASEDQRRWDSADERPANIHSSRRSPSRPNGVSGLTSGPAT